MLIFIGLTSRRSSRCYFIFCAVFEIVLDIYYFQLSIYTDSMCLAPARSLCQSAGDCTWSIALQLLFQLETLLIGLFISWGVKLFSSVKIHKIQRIRSVHITVHIYCMITCNIKSLLNVPKISHISRKISEVSRFPAKCSDSRNKFVFLPKQPLLELSPPVLNCNLF